MIARWLIGLGVAAASLGCGGSGGPPAAPAPASSDGGGPSDARTDAGVDPWEASPQRKIAGPALTDGWGDLFELPPPVNVEGGWTDSAAVSADGRSLLFGYTRYDFWEFYASRGATRRVSGPARAGMTGDAFKIFEARPGPAGWDVAYHPLNDPDGAVAQAAASQNAAGDVLVFTTFSGAARALAVAVKSEGAWSRPVPLPFGGPCEDDNGFVVGTKEAYRLYFESKRSAPTSTACGEQRHLFVARYEAGAFSAPERVPGLEPGPGAPTDESQIWVRGDELEITYTGIRPPDYGVYAASRATPGAPFVGHHLIVRARTTPPLAGQLVLVGEANRARIPGGEVMVLMCGVAAGENDAGPVNVSLRICATRRGP